MGLPSLVFPVDTNLIFSLTLLFAMVLFLSYLFFASFRFDFFQYRLDTEFIDDAHTLGRNGQGGVALLARYPKTTFLQVGQKATSGFVLCVRDVITYLRFLSCHLAYFRHGLLPYKSHSWGS